jgi:signal transduction histidine kinase
MIIPQKPKNEAQRLRAVRSYKLLDTLPEDDYDAITQLVADFLSAPISLVTLLDADINFLKSHHGTQLKETPRDLSFCAHAILSKDAIFEVSDARLDPKFKKNPLVGKNDVIFYAGVPLINSEGYPLGTLCVIDNKPRTLSEHEKNTLITLAKQVVKLFELHKHNNELSLAKKTLLQRNKQLKEFAGVVSQDLKSPLANITSLSRLIKEEYKQIFDAQGMEYLDYIEESSDRLSEYIDGMLKYYKSDDLLKESNKQVSLHRICYKIEDILFIDNSEFKYPKEDVQMHLNKAALEQILLNLIGNSLKYNTSKIPFIALNSSQDEKHYIFSIVDNGIGIDADKQELMFDLFKTGNDTDRNGKKGSGIGLATVKNLVIKLGGTISVDSEVGKGATFTFSVAK